MPPKKPKYIPPKKQIDPMDKHVGQQIRINRMVLRLSQEKLGDALGLTFQQVQKYEKGTNRVSASRLQAIANFLKLPSVDKFFEGGPGYKGGNSKPQEPSAVYEMMSSHSGVRLAKQWPKLTDGQRNAVVNLVERIVDKDDA